jgi:hypothetical protein
MASVVVKDRKISSKDVEFAKVKARADLNRQIVVACTPILSVIACALPIYVLGKAIKPLAGETTVVDVKLAFSLTIALSLVTNVLQWGKGRAQKAEIKRLRRRTEQIEAEGLRRG